MTERDRAETDVFEDGKQWPYPLLPRCPVCRSPSLLYYPFSEADTKVYCTRCLWKASIRHVPERNPTIDSLPDVPDLHEVHEIHNSKTPNSNAVKSLPINPPAIPRARRTIEGLGPSLPPAGPLELGPAGQTVRPSTNFVDMPDPPWADKPMPGVPHPPIDEDDEVDPEEWSEWGSPVHRTDKLPEE